MHHCLKQTKSLSHIRFLNQDSNLSLLGDQERKALITKPNKFFDYIIIFIILIHINIIYTH